MKCNLIIARLHSSRMRTARALTVSPSMLCAGGCLLRGVCSQGGGVSALGGSAPERGCLLWGVSTPGVCSGRVSALGGICSWGVSAPGGCLGGVCSRGCLLLGGVCSWGMLSAPRGVPGPRGCTWSGTPPCGQTHTCKHITLPQTSFAGGKYVFSSLTFDCSVLVCTSIILLDFMGSYTSWRKVQLANPSIEILFTQPQQFYQIMGIIR